MPSERYWLPNSHINTYAQKSSTVSNAVMSLRFAVHSLVRSFLKNHRAHLFCRGCLMSESGAIMAPSSTGSSSSSSTLSSYNSKAWYYIVNHCNIIINIDRKTPQCMLSVDINKHVTTGNIKINSNLTWNPHVL